eukprot:1575021-Karenia_brevis.AAC.1
MHDSAPGPDGISLGIYQKLQMLTKRPFLQAAQYLVKGGRDVGEDFNLAFLTCIAKAFEEEALDGKLVVGVGNTRPISVVDAANRIIAGILANALERCVSNRISKMQRGF